MLSIYCLSQIFSSLLHIQTFIYICNLVCVVLFYMLFSQLCPTICDPMDCSTPGFPVLHYLPEFVQVMSVELAMLLHICFSIKFLFLKRLIPLPRFNHSLHFFHICFIFDSIYTFSLTHTHILAESFESKLPWYFTPL